MSYRVILTPEAEAQLDALYKYIAREASLSIATDYIDGLLKRIERLADFPHRGSPRDDVRPGMRTIPFRRRIVTAYDVKGGEVRIAGIFYAGQDFETMLRDD